MAGRTDQSQRTAPPAPDTAGNYLSKTRSRAEDGVYGFIDVEVRVLDALAHHGKVAALPHKVQFEIASKDVVELLTTLRQAVTEAESAESEAQLSRVMQGSRTLPSSPRVASLRAVEAHWRAIKERYGFLSSHDVNQRQGSSADNASAGPSRLARTGHALAVKRGGRNLLFPAFQFTDDGGIYPVIPKVLALLGTGTGGKPGAGWSPEAIVLWLTSPNAFIEDDEPPADHLGDQDAVLTAAAAAVSPT